MLIAFIATAALAIPPQTKVSTVTDDYAGTKVNDEAAGGNHAFVAFLPMPLPGAWLV